ASFINVGENFTLNHCVFAGPVRCDGLRAEGNFEVERCEFTGREPLLSLRNARLQGDLSILYADMPNFGILDAGSAYIRGRLRVCGLRMGREAEEPPPGGESRKGRQIPVYGLEFSSATIEGGADLGADYRAPDREPQAPHARDRSADIERIRWCLLNSNQEGLEIIEQAFLEDGWIGATTRIKRKFRVPAEPKRPQEGQEEKPCGELVRNIIYGDVVFRSARIRGNANFSGIRIGRADDAALGDLNLTHTTISGDVNIGTMALLRSGKAEELLGRGVAKTLFGSSSPPPGKTDHIALSPTDIDGFVAGRFLTVHGDLKLHGPRADRLFDETPHSRNGVLCSIDLENHSSTYLYYLLLGAENCEPAEFSGHERRDGRRKKLCRLDLSVRLASDGRELFTPPFSFARVGRGLDLRNATVRGHMDLTNVRTNVRNAGGARLCRRLRRKLKAFYEEDRIREFCKLETGRCEIRLADVTIGGDLRALSDRKDAIYGKDLESGAEEDDGASGAGAGAGNGDDGDSVCEPSMWLRTVCARLDMESARIEGDAQLSGLEIYHGPERRSGSLYAADADIKGRFILERQESYYGRPKRARIERELGLPGLEAAEVALSALVFTDERSGLGISFEGARISRLLLSQPTPLFINLNHIQVTHWDLAEPLPAVWSPPEWRWTSAPAMRFAEAFSSMTLWALWVAALAWLGIEMALPGATPATAPGGVSAFGVLLAGVAGLAVLQFGFNVIRSVERSFFRGTGASLRGLLGDLINLAALPAGAVAAILFYTRQGAQPALSEMAAATLIVLAVAGLQLFPRLPARLLDWLQSLVTGRRLINFCLKAEELRREKLKPVAERKYPWLLGMIAAGILSAFPRVFHSYDWVSSSPWLSLLTKSKPFQADAYLRMHQSLQYEGRESEAGQIFRAMKKRDRRESRPIWRDFLGTLWRFFGERLVVGPLLGYGTRHWALILLWLFVAGAGFLVFAVPRGCAADAQCPPGESAPSAPASPSGTPEYEAALWTTLRHTIPVIDLAAPSDAPLPEDRLDRMLCPGFMKNGANGPMADLQTDIGRCMFANLGPAFDGTVARLLPGGVFSLSGGAEGAGADYVFRLRTLCLHGKAEGGCAPGPSPRFPDWSKAGIARYLQLINWVLWPLFIAQLTGLIRWQARTASESAPGV
ncbi:MAG: hypothetical protein ACLFWF_10840, partial [Alphaproteobacteria bacterium]